MKLCCPECGCTMVGVLDELVCEDCECAYVTAKEGS